LCCGDNKIKEKEMFFSRVWVHRAIRQQQLDRLDLASLDGILDRCKVALSVFLVL